LGLMDKGALLPCVIMIVRILPPLASQHLPLDNMNSATTLLIQHP